MAFGAIVNAGFANFLLDFAYLDSLEKQTGLSKEQSLSFAAGVGARLAKGGLKTAFRTLGAIQVAEEVISGKPEEAAKTAGAYMVASFGTRWASKQIKGVANKAIAAVAKGKVTKAVVSTVAKVANKVLPKVVITAVGALGKTALKWAAKLAWPVAIAWTIYDVGKLIYDWIKGRRK